MDCYKEQVQAIRQMLGVDQRIVPHASSVTLEAVIEGGASTVDAVRWEDPCGYAQDLNPGGATNPQAFTVKGPIRAQTLANDLLASAMLVSQFNYKSNVDNQLEQRIKLFDPTYDQSTGGNVSLDPITQERNTQFRTDLYTQRGDSFFLTKNSVLEIPVAPEDIPAEGEGDLRISLVMWGMLPVDYGILNKHLYDSKGLSLEQMAKRYGAGK